MVNTSIVRLFYILDAAEKKRIRKKLEAQERSEDLLALFNYLYKNIKRPKRLDKELVFASVYSELKNFDNKKLTGLRFRLYRFIEDEIVISQIMGVGENSKTEHLIQKEMVLLDYFRDKVVFDDKSSVEGVSKLVEKKMHDVEVLINESEVRDVDYYLNVYRLSHYLYYNLTTEIRGDGQPYMESLMQNLDHFYSLAKMRYSYESMQRKIIFQEKMDILFFNEVYQFTNNLDEVEIPLSVIYVLAVDLSKNLDKKKIIEFKNKVFKYSDKMGRLELAGVLNLLLNLMFQIKRSNNIDMAYTIYEVNKFALDNKIFVNSGVMAPQLLVNFAVNCLEIKRHSEIETAIQNYKFYIPEKYRDKTISLCRAYIKFGEKNFYEAYLMLQNKHFKHCDVSQKILLLKCFYELENLEQMQKKMNVSLYDFLNSFRRFIRRKNKEGKISTYLYDALNNLAKFTLKLNSHELEKEIIFKQINENNMPISNKKWLLDKIKEK